MELAAFLGIPGPVFLILSGFVAGVIDSIAGGGGLVMLPALSFIVGPGPDAIGTNKIVGLTGALFALWVYLRAGHVDWGRSWIFVAWVGLGALFGSLLAPLMPPSTFRWLMMLTCPIILFIVWKKDLWIRGETLPALRKPGWRGWMNPAIAGSGIACGLYDGLWGPGGGTFMVLSLFFVGRLNLLAALAAAKVANAASASVALVSFSYAGYVHWEPGLWGAAGIAVGALLGARSATRSASQIVRPVLVVVVALLVTKLFLE
jgi:uncharacterized protein